MFSGTLNLWGQGAVTLPKKWRDKYPTKHYLAKEAPDGSLIIKPILEVEYWEDAAGNFGLHFPTGIEAGELAAAMRKEQKKMKRGTTAAKRKVRKNIS